MTTFYGVLDPAERRFTWSNAGHEPAILLRRATGAVEHLASGDIPLGIDLERRFEAGAPVCIEDGDLLVIGSDGISQARDREGRFLGSDGMAEVMRCHRNTSAPEILDALLRAALAHEGGEALEDDATLVVIKCAGYA